MKITESLTRIHAHLCGDGSISFYKTSEKDRINRAQIEYSNKNPILLNNFREDMRKEFGVKMTLRKDKEVIVKSIKLAMLIKENFGDLSSRKWRIPHIIKTSQIEIKLEWLKAFFEDEAYHEIKYNRLKIKSVNYNGLKDVQDILNSLRIVSKITGPNCDGSWYLTIPKFSSIDLLSTFKKEQARKGTFKKSFCL